MSSSKVCDICPHQCRLMPFEYGRCKIYQHSGYGIENQFDAQCSILSVEPIEKRPFFHFLPGSRFLSVGFKGCPLVCEYCVPGDTLIRMPDGLKRICQIQDGEPIIVFGDLNSDQRPVLAHVGHVFCREAEEVIELEVDGQTIQLTPRHPVLSRRGWVKAEDLTIDDEVLCDKTYSEQLHCQQENEEKALRQTE